MAPRTRACLGLGIAIACALGCGDGSPAAAAPPAGATFASGDALLSYAIDLPAGPGPFPGVVLGHGSGRETKTTQIWLARQWVARGYAVMRFDKRGVGESTGEFKEVGVRNSDTRLPLLAADLAAAAETLARHPRVDPDRIGFMGVSQGGWTVPLAATLFTRARFAVLLVGPPISVGLQIDYQNLTGANPDQPTRALEPRLDAYAGPSGYDPRAVLRRLDLPVLWLYGGADRLVPTLHATAVLASLARPRFTWIVYPGADHSLLGAPVWSDIDRWLAGGPP